MTKRMPHHIEDFCLSVAWAKAFLAVREHHEIPGLTVSFTGFEDGAPIEDSAVRTLMDDALRRVGKQPSHTVANTIFPKSLWVPSEPPPKLFDRYLRILPRIQRTRANQYGTYFQRMIDYGESGLNQLEFILDAWKSGNHRRSALQLLILYPAADDKNQRRRGFPCLSQISFGFANRSDHLIVTGYYPMHHIFERAYGNYLGLAWLGEFVAREMSLRLERVTCVAALAKRDFKKAQTSKLAEELSACIGRGQ